MENKMNTCKLSEMAIKDPSLNGRVGKFCEDICKEIFIAERLGDYHAQMILESIANEAIESIQENDYAKFEEAERDFAKHK